VDNKAVIKWIVSALGRGVAWFLAVKLGIESVQADSLGLSIAEALGALVVAGISIYSSVAGRRKLLEADPPSA
jgi:hypothetical protein